MDYLEWLQNWYKSQCNNEWEHSYGVTISTLDNPGWSVKIELNDTIYSQKKMIMMEKNTDTEENNNDWYRIYTKDSVFYGFGGPLNLKDIVKQFNIMINS